MAPKNERRPPNDREPLPEWLLLIIGLLLILIPVSIGILSPGSLRETDFYLRICAALGAALIGAFIPGALQVDFPGVKAAGAVALFVLVFLTNPPQRAAQAVDKSIQPKSIKVCMGNGNDGGDCLANADGHFECATYKSVFGGGGPKADEELLKRFCPSNRGKVVNTINHDGGQCGWTAFQVTCDAKSWWQ